MTKKQQQKQKTQKKPLQVQGANVRTSCISFSLSKNSHRTRQTNVGDNGCAEACAERFSALKDQHWRHSLQSITRPFQKRFRQVFGNARILIFYLPIKAWEEKSLPKSHLGWFFLVCGKGKATKDNMSIFWFIWPLKGSYTCWQRRSEFLYGNNLPKDLKQQKISCKLRSQAMILTT